MALKLDLVEDRDEVSSCANQLKQQLKEKLIEQRQYIAKNGEGLPEIRNWKWGAAKAGAPPGDLPAGRA